MLIPDEARRKDHAGSGQARSGEEVTTSKSMPLPLWSSKS